MQGIKLYGLAREHCFLCFCCGIKAFFVSILWTKRKGIKLYKGHTTSESIIFNARNTYPKWWFFGFMQIDSSKGFIDYEEYIDDNECKSN